MSNDSIIDLNHLEKYVAGDHALREEILDLFSEQLSALSVRFDIENNDEDWRDVVHTLKGASRGVGAWKLGELCAEAERLVGETSGKREKRAAILVSIRRQIEGTAAAVEALRAPAA